MIRNLSLSLKNLLVKGAGAYPELAQAQIAFDRPSESFNPGPADAGSGLAATSDADGSCLLSRSARNCWTTPKPWRGDQLAKPNGIRSRSSAAI